MRHRYSDIHLHIVRLNKYPALRDFLKKEVTKDMYENMKVEWKSGAVPTAYFFDENGKQVSPVAASCTLA